MGASCCKSSDTTNGNDSKTAEFGTLGVMFRRIDKEGKGYINLKNLEDLMKDDKTYFRGKDANHIMEKYGNDGQMNFDHFKTWWNSTYTTYNDDAAITRLVEDAQAENEKDMLDAIPEFSEVVPHNSNVAISRS